MIQTSIEFDRPSNDRLSDDGSSLRSRIESAARLLELEIGDLDPLVVTARWRYLSDPKSEPRVELALEYRVRDEISLQPGDTVASSTAVSFSLPEFFDLDQLKRKLGQVASNMNLRIMQSNLEGLVRQRKRLAALVHAEG